MAYYTRQEVLRRMRAQVAQGIPIVGTGAGIGMAARAEDLAGSDVIIVYGTGKYRMSGRSSMGGRFAFGDANGLVLSMAEEIMPVAKQAPVFCGVFVQDPFRDMGRFLGELQEAGYSGVQNVPGMGGMDQMEGDAVVEYLDAMGLGVSQELKFLQMAQKAGMVTSPYAYHLDQCIQMASIGADIIVMHAGLTAKGMNAAQYVTPMDYCVELLRSWVDAIRRENPECLILCHGGPIAEPEDFRYIKQQIPEIAGFYGASSVERIPVEYDLVHTVRAFKALKR